MDANRPLTAAAESRAVDVRDLRRNRSEMQAFLKVEGLGNDFLLVDERDSGRDDVRLPLALRQAACVRQSGVGADGVLTLLRSRVPGALCRLHITNADGSVPQMCGNGLRCVVAALAEWGELEDQERVKIDTDAGILEVMLDADAVMAEVGLATLGPLREEVDLGQGLQVFGQRVSVGNPHFILEDQPADAATARRIGPLVEVDPAFPERTNVEFFAREGNAVHLVVWERGVGLTQACGTGACATVAALATRGDVPASAFVPVHLPGGVLHVKVDLTDDGPRVWMRGPAQVVYAATLTKEFVATALDATNP